MTLVVRVPDGVYRQIRQWRNNSGWCRAMELGIQIDFRRRHQVANGRWNQLLIIRIFTLGDKAQVAFYGDTCGAHLRKHVR
ncbi:hypothetical protein [Paraburkholderia kirstenboschensis]|uniref:hypothetical protein n=1 Tax=Paraburkholderia kirstenboschensis TaxID=1245436 RepID=UPI000FFBD82A|nr:hypothetical protein [Paraburkholderia kirstenboschensis]